MRQWWKAKIIVPLKNAGEKLVHINDRPEKIALGFALGAFIGVFPTFWLGGIIILGLCYLFRLNYAAAILGSVLIMNPLSTPFFWMLSAAVGSALFSKDAQVIIGAIKDKTVFQHLNEIVWVYLAGNIIVSVIVAALSYWVVLVLVRRFKLKTGRK